MATLVDDKYSAALSIVLGSLAVAVSDVVSWKMLAYFGSTFGLYLSNIFFMLCSFHGATLQRQHIG
jgi:hypothetical protein